MHGVLSAEPTLIAPRRAGVPDDPDLDHPRGGVDAPVERYPVTELPPHHLLGRQLQPAVQYGRVHVEFARVNARAGLDGQVSVKPMAELAGGVSPVPAEILGEVAFGGRLGWVYAARVDQRELLEAETGQLLGHLSADPVQADDEGG